MKYMVIVLLVLLPMALLAQSQPAVYVRAQLVKTYSAYTATSDDTTGWITVPVQDVLNAREVTAIAVATDSVWADVNFIGRNHGIVLANGTVPNVVTYADSLIGRDVATYSATAPYILAIPLKNGVVDRLAGCTQFKIGTVFRATGQGTGTPVLKWYLHWKK